ncbi:cytochrome c heme lyase subunit CcmF [Photobacterium aphoticum]|uniref:Cytochrome c heme lyase subunit CcmF n=1 Tax=Photobacterium aphoticum TaxID=754436 RepID=A0A090R0U7_9GAMM|nr:cytochrome c heme lyase subunit CcmF [Photobacterium aphoticum]
MARPLTYGVFGMILVSFIILSWAFYTNDFTVAYVASNSNSLLPWYYRLSAVWGGHEGSLLLWVLIQLPGRLPLRCSRAVCHWNLWHVCCP